MTDRSRATVLAITLAVTFFIGITLVMRPEREFTGLGSATTPSSLGEIENKLMEAKTPEGLAAPNVNVPLAWFKTPEGRMIQVTLQEMSFEDSKVIPDTFRSNSNIAIVSSIDQEMYVSNGSSGKIMKGCSLDYLQGISILPGQIYINQCKGSYRNQGIDTVINVAIVTFSEDKIKQPPCVYKISEQDNNNKEYKQCTIDQLNLGLSEILSATNTDHTPFTSIIIPELATGYGNLSKQEFYQQFFDILTKKLNDPTARSKLPKEIILQVWSKDKPDSFLGTIDGIRRSVDSPVTSFRNMDRPKKSNGFVKLIGIAGGLGFTITGMMLFPGMRSALPALRSLAETPSLTKLIAWILICFGLADSLSGLLTPAFPSWDIPLQLILGVIIVPVVAPLIKAMKSVQDSFAGDIPAK